jgi:chemotaxis protein MotB
MHKKLILAFFLFLGFSSTALAYNEADVSRAKKGDKKLSGADLSSADLKGVNLKGADLSNANLTFADLSGAKLRGANLKGANLTKANLSEANLSKANLEKAELWSANIKGANLRGAKLDGAELSGADLSDTNLRKAKSASKNSKEDLLAQLDAEKKKSQGAEQKNEELDKQLKEISDNLTKKEKELNDILGQLKNLESDKDKAEANTKDKLSYLEKQMKKTQEELETLRKQRAEAEKRLAVFKDLTAKLQAMIDSGKLKVSIRNGQMIVELPAEVLFDSGKAELSTAGKETILQVAATLKSFDRRFLVAGHTDNKPLLKTSKFGDNWELSTARATTVTKTMIEGGVPAKSLAAAGYSEYDPIADNTTEEGRKKNRRIEIVLLPNLSELPQISDK